MEQNFRFTIIFTGFIDRKFYHKIGGVGKKKYE